MGPRIRGDERRKRTPAKRRIAGRSRRARKNSITGAAPLKVLKSATADFSGGMDF